MCLIALRCRSGVIRIHGIRPQPRDGQPAGIFVANHTSMIDFMVLLQVSWNINLAVLCWEPRAGRF